MTGPTTHTTTNSEKQDAGARRSQGEDEGNPRLGVSIYLFNADKGVIEPLNVPARNTIVHNSPALVKHAVANTLQRQANKKGLYEHTSGCVVHWKPSAIPFHIEFEVSVSKNTCQHLASVRNIKAKNAVSKRFYALFRLV